MPNWNRSTPLVCAVLATAAYFVTALWLKHSYVEPPKSAGVVFRLNRPFFKARGSEIAFAVNDSSLDYLSDTVQSGPVSVYAV
jgi:hypothetical protein